MNENKVPSGSHSYSNQNLIPNDYLDERAEKFITYITPLMFGGISGNVDKDNTEALEKAIEKSVEMNVALDLRRGPWRVKKPLDFTSVRQIITDWSGRIVVNPEDFQVSNGENYVINIGDPNTTFREGRANYNSIVGVLALISESRTRKLNGIFIKGSLLSIDSIRVINFNGEGITISSTWDSAIKSISAELCGNIDSFQIGIFSGGDTSNCLSIARIQSERAFHRCLSVDCIRSVINTIHAERTQILTDNDGTRGLPNGLNYCNLRINVSNTTINQLIHDCINPDNGNYTLKNPKLSMAIINLDVSSIREVLMPKTIVSSNYGKNSIFENISLNAWFIWGRSRGYIVNNPRVINTMTVNSGVSFSGGSFGKLDLLHKNINLSFSNVDIQIINVSGSSKATIFYNCNIKNDFSMSSSSISKNDNLPITFVDCVFRGRVKGGEGARAIFRQGYINSVDLSSDSIFVFDGVKMDSFDYSGRAKFITKNCIVKKVYKWTFPEGGDFNVGETTERIGFLNDEGRVYIYNSDGKASWKILH